MKAPIRGLVIAAALVGLRGRAACAAQQMMPVKILSIHNPGSDSARRKLAYVGREAASANQVVGDPVTSGAKFRVKLAVGGDQCFDLPASGWGPVGDLGFKYKAFSGPGAVVAALIRKQIYSDDFIVKVKAAARTGAIDLAPVEGNPSFATNFKIGDGDEYCSGAPTPPEGISTDKLYKVRKVPPPIACEASACP